MTPSIFCRACIATATLTMISLPITTAPVPLYASTVLASPFHIPAAPKGQKKPPAELQCEKPPKPMRSIATNSMYVPGDPTHSKRDPKAYAVYQAAIAPVREYAKKATKLANKYVRSGALKSRDAVCAQDWLYGWAQANALTDMQTPQAIFNMGQLLAGFSMAYLEIRENPYLDNEKKQAIERWL
ncbi:MAG: hypothetical protein K2Q12_04875, partial [Rickettsiales bacterium]|nr:hypothetical protein [Rickettsiales bacterium]